MMRDTLDATRIEPAALQAMAGFHADIVHHVQQAVQSNEWVVVGMAQNPVVKKARRFLEAQKIPYTYIEYGSYLSKWKQRLAIKLWSGWPTFPQVFHKGRLIGGAVNLEEYAKVTR